MVGSNTPCSCKFIVLKIRILCVGGICDIIHIVFFIIDVILYLHVDCLVNR